MTKVFEALNELRLIIAYSFCLALTTVPSFFCLVAFILPIWSLNVLSLTLLLFALLLLLAPLEWKLFGMADWCMKRCLNLVQDYHSIRVRVKDENSLDPKQNYLIGYEPHSVMPIPMPVVFSPMSSLLPPQIKDIHSVASSACFWVPGIRHLWWWLGARVASKLSIKKLLTSKKSVLIVPGGVREIQCMRAGAEVIYLKKRLGFVRLAIQTGSPLVPVFAFGQTPILTPFRMGIPKSLLDEIGRKVGLQPTWVLGRWGTPLPRRLPVLIAIGTPIAVPFIENPDNSIVQEYLEKFIEQMQALFQEYKSEAGFRDLELQVH